jgi:hypothetical protein
VSAKQNLSPPRSRGLAFFCQLLGIAFLFAPSQLRGDPLEDAAHKLALKVCTAPHNPSVKMQWLESPEASGYLSEPRKRVFLDQISACGISPSENSEAPVLKVAISVTATKVLLTSDSTDPTGGRQIHMVEFPRSLLFNISDAASAPHLTSELLWEQEKPIYSAIEWIDSSTEERFLFLLSDGAFVRRRFENGSWAMVDSTDLPRGNRRSRDGDGAFLYSSPEGKLDLTVHGSPCELNLIGRISFACGANYAAPKRIDFFSNCEDSPRKLVTGNGDYTRSDRILLTSPVGTAGGLAADEKYSASVDIAGPVLDISVGQNRKAAFAVVKNLLTGNYEVYRIAAVCSN